MTPLRMIAVLKISGCLVPKIADIKPQINGTPPDGTGWSKNTGAVMTMARSINFSLRKERASFTPPSTISDLTCFSLDKYSRATKSPSLSEARNSRTDLLGHSEISSVSLQKGQHSPEHTISSGASPLASLE